ncbi:nitrogen fixation protein NifQ [Methylosinus sp. Sm6]|uniref:nitrogen fixation protein NifQ n=1 Tax=Methylosinus sp. Sm6 TaxID=2866948 RepID=UPI001C997447|nr:nitrogen fixation protein NifQ [Methylosinus sp. Sm6]MBY6239976.1 nitrogen fixation protein NifQ [Methylosinus sp. Sm6]
MAFLSEDRRSESGVVSPETDAAGIYSRLRARPGEREARDPFTAHVFACALAIGLAETLAEGRDLGPALGMGRKELRRLVAAWAPEAERYVDFEGEPESVALDEEEDQIRQLLERYRGDPSDETSWIAAIVTKRSMSPRHLWQDLGLGARDELGRLMGERFPGLAARNFNQMKWKKFFYRSLCELEGFVLCSSPTCRECGDFHDCFGDESGESALARLGRPGPRDN